MGILQDYGLYTSYKKIIKKNKIDLAGSYNIRIDEANRLYTVVNIPQETGDEVYNIRKQDIDKIAQTYIREYVSKLSLYLNTIGLSELYSFYEPIKKVEKNSYLIILGFNRFNTVEWNKFIYLRLLPFTVISSFTFLLIYYFNN